MGQKVSNKALQRNEDHDWLSLMCASVNSRKDYEKINIYNDFFYDGAWHGGL